MPITKSAKKALRQSAKRRVKNAHRISAYRNAVKKFRKMVSSEKTKEAQNFLPKVFKSLDKAAKTGVIKKNKASRLKSNLAKLIKEK